MAFQFTIERPRISGAPVLVRMSGRLTLGPQLIDFGRRIRDLIVSGEGPGILLAVEAIQDIDSAGLGELVILYTTAEQQQQRICLVNPSLRIIHLLETTKLSGILPHFEDEAAAKSWITTAP